MLIGRLIRLATSVATEAAMIGVGLAYVLLTGDGQRFQASQELIDNIIAQLDGDPS